jgi:hypothetical protein
VENFKKLMELGFIKRYDDLPPEERKIVDEQQFRYTLPVSIAYKPDSVSTAVRLCMDASASSAGKASLNNCLYKGTTSFNMGNLITRWRALNVGIASDLSKFYPSLRLRTEDWSL